MASRGAHSKPELEGDQDEETIRVVTTVTEGGRLRLPNVVRQQLRIKPGAQLVIYLRPSGSFFVAVTAETAIRGPPIPMQAVAQ